MNIALIVFGILILSIIGYYYHLKPHFNEFKRLKSDKEYQDTTYLYKKGSTRTFGPNGFDNPIINYNLRSWDAGKNWYVIDYNYDTGEFKVVGLADTIYPGLVEHLESWDRMSEYATKNGPIKLDDPEGLKLLKDAGFTIKN